MTFWALIRGNGRRRKVGPRDLFEETQGETGATRDDPRVKDSSRRRGTCEVKTDGLIFGMGQLGAQGRVQDVRTGPCFCHP